VYAGAADGDSAVRDDCGVVYGINGSRLWETRALGVFILALMLLLEFALHVRAGREQRVQIR
jgi:hypothetical protein